MAEKNFNRLLMYFLLKINRNMLRSSRSRVVEYLFFHAVIRPGEVLWEFLGGDVPLGPWNP